MEHTTNTRNGQPPLPPGPKLRLEIALNDWVLEKTYLSPARSLGHAAQCCPGVGAAQTQGDVGVGESAAGHPPIDATAGNGGICKARLFVAIRSYAQGT